MKRQIAILIIDDLQKKRATIKSKLTRGLRQFQLVFVEAWDYESARDRLRDRPFDFVILDLMIPAGGEAPSEIWSRALLADIVEGVHCYPMHVFGLTEFAELAANERQHFERSLFGLFIFDWKNDVWAHLICDKVQYLLAAVENGASYRLNSYDFDLVVLTARHDNEYLPVLSEIFSDQDSDRHPLWPRDGAHFGRLLLSGNKFKSRIALHRGNWFGAGRCHNYSSHRDTEAAYSGCIRNVRRI